MLGKKATFWRPLGVNSVAGQSATSGLGFGAWSARSSSVMLTESFRLCEELVLYFS